MCRKQKGFSTPLLSIPNSLIIQKFIDIKIKLFNPLVVFAIRTSIIIQLLPIVAFS